MQTRVLELLGPSGCLSQALPGYEAREGQLEMAVHVTRAFEAERVLLCEAGTGTGKTLAYLVPAILSGKKVIVSTATRTLQEQIFSKDLPLIERALGKQVQASLMKGLGNYVCRRRFAEFRASAEALRPSFARALEALQSFIGETESGDVGELVGLAEEDPIWHEVTSASDTRVGSSCVYYDECFVTRMKKQADDARLVVVNHHLFLADLALRGPHPGRVIPDYDAVIFDEAHLLEDIATDFFGLRVSRTRLGRMLSDTARALTLSGAADPLLGGGDARRLLESVEDASEQFFSALVSSARTEDGRVTLERDVWAGPVAKAWHALDAAIEALAGLVQAVADRQSQSSADTKSRATALASARALETGARRLEELRLALADIIDGAPGRVAWLETSPRNVVLSSSPVDLSQLFRERLFETVPSIILTSATLAIGSKSKPGEGALDGPFSFIRSRLGLSGDGASEICVDELLVTSPFDFEQNALLYTPRDLPAPNDQRFIACAVDRIAELVEIADGGAFVLTTSLRSMRALHAGLTARLPKRRLMLQGQAPKSALIGAFRSAEDAVLVATLSFWQGVDVPGRALRLVILEKIPFAVPTDPVLRARSAVAEEQGKNAFLELYVPSAAIVLKQGFGRLIRSQSDAGVVALLDGRVLKRGYGRRLLSSLPPVGRAEELEQVRSFFERHSKPRACY